MGLNYYCALIKNHVRDISHMLLTDKAISEEVHVWKNEHVYK